MSVLVFLIVSCSNNDDPVTPPQYRISRICSDNLLQLFEYDASGRISEWKYEDLTQDRSDTYNSTYRYSGEEGVIESIRQSNEVTRLGVLTKDYI